MDQYYYYYSSSDNNKLMTMMMALLGVSFVYLLCKLVFSWWISPAFVYSKIKRNGLGGPSPSFPLGNINEMRKKTSSTISSVLLGFSSVTHDIHSRVFPYFSAWQKFHGKVFVYWLGTEPFLYVADPEFLKTMSGQVLGKCWGKPSVFKRDREPMFGSGLVMVEGNDWVRHRHLITPAFSPNNLKAMGGLIVESATKMLENWAVLVESGKPEIDVEREITSTAGEVIAKTSFGLGYETGQLAFEKLKSLQITLFNSNRYVGVPFSKIFFPGKTLEAKRIGKEIDQLFFSIVDDRRGRLKVDDDERKDLLGLLLKESEAGGLAAGGKTLSARELVDECKTFFFGGHETTALAITWTMFLLSVHQEWQKELREEIKQVIGDKEVDATMLSGLKKMGWVMNEVFRLYPPAPNVQRQARGDIRVGDVTIPDGTNMWIDVVAMHHDPALWGPDVNEFRPERFKDDALYGGCSHKMGYLPFGFGGRMCVGRNLSFMEYKIFLTLILSKFSFSLSPNYCHSPKIMLSLRPSLGLPLIFQPLP